VQQEDGGGQSCFFLGAVLEDLPRGPEDPVEAPQQGDDEFAPGEGSIKGEACSAEPGHLQAIFFSEFAAGFFQDGLIIISHV